MVLVDGRLDDRPQLLDLLEPRGSSATFLSDGQLLALAWQRWREDTLDRVSGDFVLACWDRDERSLTLVRSPNSPRALLIAERPGGVSFASTAQALLGRPGGDRSLDLNELAGVMVGDAHRDGRTMFRGVRLLRQGTLWRWSEGQSRSRDLWCSVTDRLPQVSASSAAEELREHVERAVASCVRRPGGPLASQLSAGRDSSAVTATAASLLAQSGERLLAVTGAPRARGVLEAYGDRLTDESQLAAATAAFHPNIDHVVTRGFAPESIADQLDNIHHEAIAPVPNPSALTWWTRNTSAAFGAGAEVLLTGEAGNLTLSAGGPISLIDILRSRGPMAFMRSLLKVGDGDIGQWRTALKISAGAVLPAAVYRNLVRFARGRPRTEGISFLRPPLRQAAAAHARRFADEWKPGRTLVEHRVAAFQFREPNDRLFREGRLLQIRDPSADWRLIRLCLALPAELLVSRHDRRPLYEAAFKSLLPGAVLTNRKRGYQGADWFTLFTRQSVEHALARYRNSAAVQEYLDLDALDRAVAEWPSTGWHRPDVVEIYRYEMGTALAVASFLALYFD